MNVNNHIELGLTPVVSEIMGTFCFSGSYRDPESSLEIYSGGPDLGIGGLGSPSSIAC